MAVRGSAAAWCCSAVEIVPFAQHAVNLTVAAPCVVLGNEAGAVGSLFGTVASRESSWGERGVPRCAEPCQPGGIGAGILYISCVLSGRGRY